jgi:hypothetical protein
MGFAEARSASRKLARLSSRGSAEQGNFGSLHPGVEVIEGRKKDATAAALRHWTACFAMNNFSVFHLVVLYLLGVVTGVLLMAMLAAFRHDRERGNLEDD